MHNMLFLCFKKKEEKALLRTIYSNKKINSSINHSLLKDSKKEWTEKNKHWEHNYKPEKHKESLLKSEGDI